MRVDATVLAEIVLRGVCSETVCRHRIRPLDDLDGCCCCSDCCGLSTFAKRAGAPVAAYATWAIRGEFDCTAMTTGSDLHRLILGMLLRV
jgi:hypothetical protein